MIPFHDIDKPHTYAYVAGCRNAAWLVGIVHSVDWDKQILYITRNEEDDSSIIPIHVDRRRGTMDFIPSEFDRKGTKVKVICHVYSGIEEGREEDIKAGHYCRLIGKYIGRPNLLDMRPREDYSRINPDSDAFGDFDLPDNFLMASNNVELAGFVDAKSAIIREEDQPDIMVFMLRQADAPQNLIPIQIIGKKASLYHRIVTVGMAVSVKGIILPAKRPDTGESVVIVRSGHVQPAEPETDFRFDAVPDWAIEIRRRYAIYVQQERARLAALAAARQAEELARSMSTEEDEDQ